MISKNKGKNKMTKLQKHNDKKFEIRYPTDEELEWMYEEYIKSGSFEDIFGIKESKDTEFPF